MFVNYQEKVVNGLLYHKCEDLQLISVLYQWKLINRFVPDGWFEHSIFTTF